MQDLTYWQGHIRTLEDVTNDPEIVFPPTQVLEVRADSWTRPVRPGDVVRGFVDVMTVAGGPGYGMRSKVNFRTGKGVPLYRVYVPRIVVGYVGAVLAAGTTSPRVNGRAAGPWVRSTKWDAFVVPAVDGCRASLGALADAMEEDGDPLAGQVRELWASGAATVALSDIFGGLDNAT
jgi:hypothetical protein